MGGAILFTTMQRPDWIPLGYWQRLSELDPGGRVLLVMALLADEIKVREVTPNAGPWVSRFLAAVGLNPGYSWCAAVLYWACGIVGAPRPPKKADGARVAGWLRWATETGRLRNQPGRGRLCLWLNPGGQTGHIGIVVTPTLAGTIKSIEGNTGPGAKGSQSDGDGLYRRERDKAVWQFYIDLS